jgi:hypothetical protein
MRAAAMAIATATASRFAFIAYSSSRFVERFQVLVSS